MAASKYLELAVILSAVDNMSGTFRRALGSATTGYSALASSQERADAAMKSGLKMGAGAKVAIDILADLTKKYANVQEAQQDLRISMLKPGGYIDEQMYQRDVKLAEGLSKKYAGTQMAYYDMIRAMIENRLDNKDVLGGVGNAVGMLSELFNTMPAESAIFAARMKNDMKVPAAEMIRMIDLAARLKQVGVGHTGAETIQNLTEFYSKAGLGATNLGLHGTKDAMELGALGGMYIAKGQDAPSVGTTFRRIFDNISNPKKYKAMNEEAAKYGRHLSFFDKDGKFSGVQNFVAQLSTLKGMNTQAISQILGPAGSAQGMSGDVLKSISLYGREDYENFLERIANQADITTKVVEKQKALNQQLRITTSNIENMEANVGKSYNPVVTSAVKITGEWANVLSKFAADHQKITLIGTGALGAVAGVLALGSAIQLVRAAWGYSQLGFAALGGVMSNLWSSAAIGAESFANVLLRSVVPAIGEVITGLAGLGVGGLAGLASIVAGAGYIGYKMYSEHQKDKAAVADYEADIARNPIQSHYTPISDKIKRQFEHRDGPLTRIQHRRLPGVSDDDQRNFGVALAGDLARRNQPVQQAPVIINGHTVHIHGEVGKTHVETIKDLLNNHSIEILRLLQSNQHDTHRTAY